MTAAILLELYPLGMLTASVKLGLYLGMSKIMHAVIKTSIGQNPVQGFHFNLEPMLNQQLWLFGGIPNGKTRQTTGTLPNQCDQIWGRYPHIGTF